MDQMIVSMDDEKMFVAPVLMSGVRVTCLWDAVDSEYLSCFHRGPAMRAIYTATYFRDSAAVIFPDTALQRGVPHTLELGVSD
ncbi:hypothetical protein E4U21_003322 [Claviceps maximensis]|nr:hypothetical protein E4U21_003322 [Claviceps maximensis]